MTHVEVIANWQIIEIIRFAFGDNKSAIKEISDSKSFTSYTRKSREEKSKYSISYNDGVILFNI